MTDPASIIGYHAHIYYDPATTRDRAERLRARIGKEFPAATLGRCTRWRFRAISSPHCCRG
jgi:DOPA 4,5-dioxygenase